MSNRTCNLEKEHGLTDVGRPRDSRRWDPCRATKRYWSEGRVQAIHQALQGLANDRALVSYFLAFAVFSADLFQPDVLQLQLLSAFPRHRLSWDADVTTSLLVPRSHRCISLQRSDSSSRLTPHRSRLNRRIHLHRFPARPNTLLPSNPIVHRLWGRHLPQHPHLGWWSRFPSQIHS